MTPSIIRRFARYHGLALERVDDASVVTEAYGIAPIARHVYSPSSSNWSAFRDACDKTIQSLTRIEDAEMLMARIDEAEASLRVPGLENERAALALHSYYEFDVSRLLSLAGIDSDKWREVRDEEA